MNRHDYDLIPEHMMADINKYIEKGHGMGHFLTALFANDLMEAIKRADEHNLKILPVYASYLWNECPSDSHGSYEIVEAWRKKKGN